MSAASNVNTYSLLKATEHIIDSVEMQIDDEVNEYKRVKLSLAEVTLSPTTTNALSEEAVAKIKSAETLLTPTSITMTLSQTTIKTNYSENETISLTENSHAEHTHMAGLEIDDQRISEATGKVDDQNIAINDNSMLVMRDASEEIDKIETESIGTIKEEKGTDPIPTYSATERVTPSAPTRLPMPP
ncbi:hypothetical protein C2G38_2166272 [Gigaspora rosea]|uniref:Uncharacterized protein n=1 Tax=Gigaspora rosea TaxID=44941 RepID=A0A397VTM7_9GLOM|nr:hypothetical protein C2G38_2166272 [Gigaspora rosea]